MFSFLYNNIFYKPLYNGLIIFLSYIPWINVGVAVILFTILIRLILFPISQKSVRTQYEMKKIEPELDGIKEKYKDDKQTQAQKIMEVYRNKKINPFSGILLLIIQLPILWALYAIFLRGGLPDIKLDLLYPFVQAPDAVNMMFFGIDVAEKSTILAALAGLTQFLQIHLSSKKLTKPKDKENNGQKSSFKDELAKSMSMQMKYIMPFMIFIVARSFPIVVSLYLVTSNMFSVVQELIMAKKFKKEDEQPTN